MKEYKTKHAIGDLVYLADANGIDRDVIKAIKIVGLKEKVEYGFKRNASRYDLTFFYNPEPHVWYTPGQIFEDKESAQAHHDNLRAKQEAETAKRRAEEKRERKAELQKQLEELENE